MDIIKRRRFLKSTVCAGAGLMTASARRPFSISAQAEKDRKRPNILLASGKFENPREEVHARLRHREHQGKLNALLQEQKDLRVLGTGDILER